MAELGELKRLPLHDLHAAAGAKFGGFAGWSMPLTYPAGVMKEHLHCREATGLFDISHMKLFAVSGPQAAAALSRACPIEADGLATGQSKYTFFLNGDAGILDDLIVTRVDGERFVVVANAGNAEADEAHLREVVAGFNCRIDALDRVFLALQGPQAEAVARDAGLEIDGLAFMNGRETNDGGFIARSGYTGEDGFEIAVPLDAAQALAERLAADPRVEWIGLAARDSLRLEAGLCLHGQDITPDTNPVDAGLTWAIPKALRAGGSYIGADALAKAIANGPRRKRVGLKPDGRQPVRAGAALVDADGAAVGSITSGGFGPSFGGPVAMGSVDAAALEGPIFAEVRGNRMPLALHPLPFQPHRMRKG
ncbi:glycine cleavage system aminomethyltransferase GcvT [Aliihoeflea sp. 40Bstr573]|uniref:glycine cleavage system aminomethyltransferase GcvT n=1 Tax=Aliihoeflea sp. 40Bstr573 TaxID=2696467 RepID=UPI002094957C|nr:glycine cleavage system aminomethyltransferase GcvT [Aliihoeflea sp. 40Bstr573]MCO6385833.1 glycine cleavage system aminomethyltransferase GcvT [Aliihoeflea sp. 40Bstr573]